MTNNRLERVTFAVFILLIIWWGLLILSSCARMTSTPMIYQSEEYIVYRLQRGDTPAVLAERFLGDKKKSWVIEDANEATDLRRGEVIVIPLEDKNIAGVTADGFQVVPILSYHHWADNCNSPLCVPAGIFDQQMKYLKKNGYRVISMRELRDFLNYRHPLPKRSVVISIDDGYRSTYDIAYPIMKRYGFTATLFIYTDFVGASRNAITWDQLREMKADGFEVGSHTLSHTDLTQQREGENDQEYMSRIEKELLVSKKIIDKELGQNTIYLAFPFGRYDSRVLGICERLNYEIGVSVKRGSNPFFADPLALRRNQILGSEISTFVSRLKTFEKF